MKAFDMGTMPRTSMRTIRAMLDERGRERTELDSMRESAQQLARPYLLSGSYAYDTVLHHPQAFRQRILPDAIDKLNVSFDVAAVGEDFGGCAGNIAYNAALLGDEPMLVGNLGADGERYLQRLQSLGLDTTTLGVIPVLPTAHAWMLTDAQGNQIISFHSGAMSAPVRLPYAPPALWHIAPEDPVNMVRLALAARAAGADYFFDPGQALPALLEGVADHIAPLSEVLAGAKGIFVNEYECRLMCGKAPSRIFTNLDQFMVITRGARGAELLLPYRIEGRDNLFAERLCFNPVKADAVVDPTGCGDAFRAGFLHAYTRALGLSECVGIGLVMGALAVGAPGGQNHHVTCDDVYARLRGIKRQLVHPSRR